MSTDYLQNLRYKLQKRVRRLNSTKPHLYHFALKNFWGFLGENPILSGVMNDLAARCPQIQENVDGIIKEVYRYYGDSELEEAALGYFMLQACAGSDDQEFEQTIGIFYLESDANQDDQDYIDVFFAVFVEPFYEYLDEHLDDERNILAFLIRYKHKCEWFQAEQLYNRLKEDTGAGEKRLAYHLYEYLHDQGIHFNIESTSSVGKADLVAAQMTDDPLIADAKIFEPNNSRGISYIAKGFNQIYLYTLSFNESFGYLVIYNVSGKDLTISVDKNTLSIPFVVHNHKTIFIIVIDIYPHETTASKRGRLQEYQITEQDLINQLEESSALEN